MTNQTYLQESSRTDGDIQRENFENTVNNSPQAIADLIHAAMGVATESGELMDAVKRHLYYGKVIDKVNIKEEVGDILWYLAKIARDQGFSFDEAMEMNIAKLQRRFPNAFTNDEALNRNLDKERKAMEDFGMVVPPSKEGIK
jgi:NTP pyrophosphatase (non-canonical NTP hydrolase)